MAFRPPDECTGALHGPEKQIMLIQVVMRIPLHTFEQSWAMLTSMSHPTIAPYTHYSCVYNEQARTFQPM